jgi:hypothetical protein
VAESRLSFLDNQSVSTPFLISDNELIVTAFVVNLDRFEAPEYIRLGPPRKGIFLVLAHNHLKDGGRLVLLLNGHTPRVASVMEYFVKKGARVNGAWIDFETLSVQVRFSLVQEMKP